MTHSTRSILGALVFAGLATATCVAQSSGQATYKAKCANCHGAAGTPNPALAKMLGVKPVSDPSIQALTPAQMIDTVIKGKGKMKPISGLTDAQVKDVVKYFKSLK